MLSKVQKIWLWIFGAIFLIPEMLWSPIMNFYYELLQTSKSGGTYPFRDNFLQNPDNLKYLRFVILLQSIGSISFLILWIKNKRNINSKLVFWVVLFFNLLIVLISIFASYFALSFNPSIG
jgi:hypothetical protein